MSVVKEIDPSDPKATVCGNCGRAWDDSISTSMTPAPSGRCPFEYEHEEPKVLSNGYPVETVQGSDLDSSMVLIGESGGLSAIYEVENSSAMPGLLRVETEHGPLYLDPDEGYNIYDDSYRRFSRKRRRLERGYSSGYIRIQH